MKFYPTELIEGMTATAQVELNRVTAVLAQSNGHEYHKRWLYQSAMGNRSIAVLRQERAAEHYRRARLALGII